MIYKGLNRTGEIETVKAHGGADIAEVYGGINEANPIYYKTRAIAGQTPLSYKALSKPLSDYLISGNTVQDGTPTPESPVDVVGCGEKTGNLFDIDNALENYYLKNGVPIQYNVGEYVLSDYIPIASDTATISAECTVESNFGAHWAVYDENRTFIRGGAAFLASIGFHETVLDTSGATFIRVDYAGISLTDCMLNTGSTALPYEPYGYKLPLTVNGTEYPIYLGQVPTTRRIKKYEFTGQESFFTDESKLYNNTLYFGTRTGFPIFVNNRGSLNSHFYTAPKGNNPQDLKYECSGFNPIQSYSNFYYMRINLDTIGSPSADVVITAFKTWLATQYTAGTPVTVWYVLAEPETGIVNEPLHKIGDYADTVSFAQAGVTIPTVAGANTLTANTTVQPSEVSITGNIKEVST